MTTLRHDNAMEDQQAIEQRRIILVGRTGLDQLLRRDAAVELVRARTALDAVGELSDPIDRSSPTRAVVFVAPDAVDADDAEAFADAMRTVDGTVRLVAIGGEPGPFDARVDPDPGVEELAALLSGDHRADVTRAPADDAGAATGASEPAAGVRDEPAPDAEPRAVLEPKPVAPVLGGPVPDEAVPDEPVLAEAVVGERDPAEPAFVESASVEPGAVGSEAGGPVSVEPEDVASGGSEVGDRRVLDAVLAGRDVVPPALETVRARLGRDDVEFVNVRHAAPAPALAADVRAGNAALGQLVLRGGGDPDAAAALAEQASWLSGWLKLAMQQKELRTAAFTDALTGAWNRRYFDHYLNAAINQAKNARLPVTLLFFDIDNFKAYNDDHGHAAGDEILVETVRLLRSVIRPTDRVCRVGGDEFAVIFYEPAGPRSPDSTPPQSVYEIARRFQVQICAHRFPKLGKQAAGTLTISGGMASYPWDGTDGVSLLDRADELAMRSKRQGKNVITLGRGAENVCKAEPEP